MMTWRTTHDLGQVRQGAPEAIKLPYDQDVTGAEVLQTYLEPRPVVAGSRCLILMDVSFIDPGRQKRVALQVGALPIIVGRDSYVAHEHFTETIQSGCFRDKIHPSVSVNGIRDSRRSVRRENRFSKTGGGGLHARHMYSVAFNRRLKPRSTTPKRARSRFRLRPAVQILSPRLFFETSASARTSKGFLIVGTRVASSRRQFKNTISSNRRFSG
jgi:hypothetical protein